MSENKLPTLKELYGGDVALLDKQSKLQALLNQPPKKDWIKQHPFVKGVAYIPIQRIEWLMTKIFLNWRVEVKNTQVIANSVVVTVTLHYQDPVNGEWNWQDGAGAAPVQTDKDAAANDFSRVKTDAVMKAVPAAESYAIKDAAEKIGKIFGKDLNRGDEIVYSGFVEMFKDYELADNRTIAMLESMINNSTLDEDEKVRLEKELSNITIEGAMKMRDYLDVNQLDPVTERGNPSQTELKKNLP